MKILYWIFGEYKWCIYGKHYSLIDTFGKTHEKFNENCKACESIRAKIRYVNYHPVNGVAWFNLIQELG